MNFKDDERYKLLHEWALHFGYYDGKIDITASDDLEAFTTHDAGLVAMHHCGVQSQVKKF